MRSALLLVLVACSPTPPPGPSATSTPPTANGPTLTAVTLATPVSPNAATAPDASMQAPVATGPANGLRVTFSGVVKELLDLAQTGTPSAAAIKEAFAPRATKIETGNSDLKYPPWAGGTRGPKDVYLWLEGDLAGLALWEDGRGWGAYAELAVTSGTLADLETIVGKTRSMPRNPDDFRSGDKVAAYVDRNGKNVRVFAELDKQNPAKVRRLTIHFEK